MARSILSSVGRMGGKNRPDDVITVQQLLDQVRVAQGGPAVPLDVDGLCGPKTIDAIQKFQLHHFGWKGADGRVDPNGPTLAKLNEFDGLPNRLPAPVPVTLRTKMSCPHGGPITASSKTGKPVLTTSDQFSVSQCVFGSPCVRVQWIEPPGKPLNTNSVGTCLNAGNIPQGSVSFR
jgi:Putative peptidoglycan binding domain